MKRTFFALLVVALCLCLCACGGAKKLTAQEVETAMAECNGTLNLETSGDQVTGFTYVVEDINADDLMDKSYARDAVMAMASGDTANITFGQYKVTKAFLPLMSIEALLGDDGDDFSATALIEKLLGVICEGNTIRYDGWTVSATVDQAGDSITIRVASK